METASKDANKKRGRPVTGNAVSDANRMRAYRARKKARALGEQLAAGLPPPRPEQPRARPEKHAAADQGADESALTRIAELEAANRNLEDEVAEARRSVAYHLSEITRLENEKDARGTSLVTGKEPARRHREDALTSWAAKNPWEGKENVRTLRTNVSRAIGTLEELRGILGRHDSRKLGYDVEMLAKTMAVLGVYRSNMDSADSYAAHAKRAAERELHAREDAQRTKMALKIFGTDTPTPTEVRAVASDLITWHAVAGTWLKTKYRGIDIAYSSVTSIYELERVIDKPARLTAELLRIAVEIAGPGRRHVDTRREETCWLGGWDDFEAWRKQMA